MQSTELSPATPTVSVGMPVYNGARYIREALDSLLAQSFRDFELIISDNASTDGTEVICQDYAARDSRIRYIRQQENCGAAANFEIVLREARREFFMWAAADDFEASPEYLLELVKVARDGGFGLVFPAVEIIAKAKDGSWQVVRTHIMDRFLTCKTRADICVASVYLYFQIYGLFRRVSLLQNIGYFQKTSRMISGDVLLIQTISVNFSICYVPGVTKIYRIHENQHSDTSNALGRLLQYVKLSCLCVDYWVREADVSLGTKSRVLLAIFRCNGHGILYRALQPIKRYAVGKIQRPVL
jgi:glycosyltransferase involved in cell wall biosynthesis